MQKQAFDQPSRIPVKTAVVVFAIALAARLIFLAFVGPQITGDGKAYLLAAQNIASHRTFSLDVDPPITPSIARPPGYSLALAPMSSAGVASPIVIAVFQAGLDSITAVCVLLLAATALGRRWAVGAALAYAMHPGPIPYSAFVLSEALFTSLLAVSAVVAVEALRRDRLALAALSGGLLGYAALVRPIALPLIVLFGLALLASRVTARRRALALASIGFSLLVVTPWIARSSYLAGRFVPVQARLADNLYGPTREHWGPEEDPYYKQVVTSRTPADLASSESTGVSKAAEVVASDPWAYVKLRAKQYPALFVSTFYLFTRSETSMSDLVAHGAYGEAGLRFLLMLVFAIAPLLLALAGLPGAWRDDATLLAAIVWVYMAVVHLPLYTSYRFWLPAIPFLLVSAASGAHALSRRYTGHPEPQPLDPGETPVVSI